MRKPIVSFIQYSKEPGVNLPIDIELADIRGQQCFKDHVEILTHSGHAIAVKSSDYKATRDQWAEPLKA